MRKHVDILRIDGPRDDTAHRDRVLHDAVGALLAEPSVRGLELNVPWPDHALRFSRRIWPELGSIDGVLSRWHDDDEPHRSVASFRGMTVVWSFVVDEHVGIERVKDWPDGAPTPGLKHLSLLCGTCPIAEFRAAYRHHVSLVHEHLPSMWRYVQNDIELAGGDRADEFAAISELSYRNQDDYDRRWRHGAEGEAEFRSHEGFLDLPKTVTMMCTEHVLRTPPLRSRHGHPSAGVSQSDDHLLPDDRGIP